MSVDRVVRAARRRLFAQALVNRVVVAWSIALALGLLWVLIEPLVREPAGRWAVVGSLVGVAALAALFITVRRSPCRLSAALEVDSRFRLSERLTSALSLPESLRDSPSGLALLADAEEHASRIRVRERFGLSLPRSAIRVPLFAGLLALVAFVYHPVTDSAAWAEKRKKADEVAQVTSSASRPTAKAADRKRPDAERPNKSPQLKEFEAELDRIARESRDLTPEQVREKVTEITSAEEKARAAARDAFDKLSRIENKLAQLEKIGATDEFKNGPARDLTDALAKGDLAKAEDAVEELRKKVKDKKLDAPQVDQLGNQLDAMRDELQRLARDGEDRLNDLIRKAKAESRDTSALDRELDRLKAEHLKDLDELASKLDAAKRELQQGKGEAAAKELERVAGQLRDLRDQANDLQDVQEQLRRAAEMRAAAGRKGGQPGAAGDQAGGQQGGASATVGRAEIAGGAGQAAGRRPENANAPTAKGADERQRSPFDPRGRKTYGGAVTGPAFTKRSPAEVGGAIAVAAQEAADAVANQPLSRDDKDAVKEYIQGLGNQKK